MTHESLLSQLRDMKAPSREMDSEIQLALFGNCVYGTVGPRNSPRPGNLASYVEQYRDLLTADDDLDDEVVPRFTASVDCAIALAAKVLPGWHGDLDVCATAPMSDGIYGARLFNKDGDWANFAGEGATPAIALVIAVLSALSAINRNGGDVKEGSTDV